MGRRGRGVPAGAGGLASVGFGLTGAGMGLGGVAMLAQGAGMLPLGGTIGSRMVSVMDSVQAAGLGAPTMIVGALCCAGFSLCLHALSRARSGITQALWDQPDPLPMLEDIDLAQQNLHLGLASLEQGVQRSIGKRLEGFEKSTAQVGELLDSIEHRSQSMVDATLTRLAQCEEGVARAITALHEANDQRAEETRATLDERIAQLESRLAEELAQATEAIAGSLAAELRQLVYVEPEPQPVEHAATMPAAPAAAMQQASSHVPMLAPEDARALAETGFHRVSSLGIFDDLDDQGELPIEQPPGVPDPVAGIEVSGVPASARTHPEMEAVEEEERPTPEVDTLPPLRSSAPRLQDSWKP